MKKRWQVVLDQPTPDIHASFFDSGGHSLLAIRLFALIEERLGKRVPVNLLFKAPTIAKLAPYLAGKESNSLEQILVPIRPSGTRPPSFWFMDSVAGYSDMQTWSTRWMLTCPFMVFKQQDFMTISLPMTALKHGNTLLARYITQTHMTDVLRYFAPSAKLFALCYIDMIYKVVMNHEEQYSIWPISRENPLDWQDVEKQETKEECLAYIEEVWTDMRTLSLRRRMKNASED